MKVENLLPDVIKPDPLTEYVIGADFHNNEAHFCIFNKRTDSIEYQCKLFTTSTDDYNTFCTAIAKYFNAKLLKETS